MPFAALEGNKRHSCHPCDIFKILEIGLQGNTEMSAHNNQSGQYSKSTVLDRAEGGRGRDWAAEVESKQGAVAVWSSLGTREVALRWAEH